MHNAYESEFRPRQARFHSSQTVTAAGSDAEISFSLRDTLAQTEVRELSFAEFRAAMEQMRGAGA